MAAAAINQHHSRAVTHDRGRNRGAVGRPRKRSPGPAPCARPPLEQATTAQPTPSPSSKYKVGEAITPPDRFLPQCAAGIGNAHVILDEGRAIVIDGTAHFVQAVLTLGQTYTDGTFKVTFNQDGKSITHTSDGSSKPVTETCEPAR
ncbi:hypothetical protein AB0D66_33765 [Streptomyces sp. NPDC048270]|uniref:hypothetical protein n=1 Tax=Streptomyces sp. NPDC048270 TaxID=3154615 RepID=UPI0033C1B042